MKIPNELTPFYICPKIFRESLHIYSYTLLSDILDYCLNFEQHAYYKSLSQITLDLGISKDSVKRAFNDLVTRNIIHKSLRYDNRGGQKPSVYRLNFFIDDWIFASPRKLLRHVPKSISPPSTNVLNNTSVLHPEASTNVQGGVLRAPTENRSFRPEALAGQEFEVASTNVQGGVLRAQGGVLRAQGGCAESATNKINKIRSIESENNIYMGAFCSENEDERTTTDEKTRSSKPSLASSDQVSTSLEGQNSAASIDAEKKSGTQEEKTSAFSLAKKIELSAAKRNFDGGVVKINIPPRRPCQEDTKVEIPKGRQGTSSTDDYCFGTSEITKEIAEIYGEIGKKEGAKFLEWMAKELNMMQKVNTPTIHLLINYLITRRNPAEGINTLKGYYELYMRGKRANERMIEARTQPQKNPSEEMEAMDEEQKATFARLKAKYRKG